MYLVFHGRLTLCAGIKSILGTWDATTIAIQNKEDELRCFTAFRRKLLCSLELQYCQMEAEKSLYQKF